MTTHSFNDLLYSKGMTEPVQQTMLWMKNRIEELEDENAAFKTMLRNSVDALKASELELHEEAKINGAGAERELKLMTDLENKQAELLCIKAHAEMQRMDYEALLRQALEALSDIREATAQSPKVFRFESLVARLRERVGEEK